MKEKKSRHLLVHIILLAGSFIMILPFAWMVLTAFKTQNEAIHVPPIIFPSHWDLQTAVHVFHGRIRIWLYQVSGEKCDLCDLPFRTDDSVYAVHSSAVPDDPENGASEYDSGSVPAESVFCIWNIPDAAVLHVTAEGAGGCGKA